MLLKNWIFAGLTSFGFFFATLRILVDRFERTNDFNKNQIFLFLAFLAWCISRGLISVVPMWGYLLNAPQSWTYAVDAVIGIVLLYYGFPVLKTFLKLPENLRLSFKLRKSELIIIGLICLTLVLYLDRVFWPWLDADEISCYGYFSKLIAGGKSFQDLFFENRFAGFIRSPLVQAWDGWLYGLVDDTYVVRLERLLNLIFCGAGIFAFLRLNQISRFWSLAALVGFFLIPELSYLALSLKVDAPVMMFELGSFLSMALAFNFIWTKKRNDLAWEMAVLLSMIAMMLAVLSLANRFSGISPVLLSALLLGYFLVRSGKNWLLSLFQMIFLLFSLLIIISPGYGINWIIYGNPFYPAKAFGPLANSPYLLTIDDLRQSWNINGLPPVILQFYLIFNLGVGLEMLARLFPVLNVLPMTSAKLTSLGWPYPLIFCILFWLFFVGRNKIADLLAVIFIYQLTLWSMGVHYSRLFVASIVLTFLLGAMIANTIAADLSLAKQRIQKLLRAWFLFSLVLCLLFHIWWTGKYFGGRLLVTSEARYHAKVELLLSKGYSEKNLLTLHEADELNRFFLKTVNNPVIYIFSQSSDSLHVFFDKRIYLRPFDFRNPYNNGGRFLLLNPAFFEDNNRDLKQRLLNFYPRHVLTTPETRWEVYSRD